MTPWLRRNWIGLIAVAVLLPATVGITFATQWNDYFQARPSVSTAVDLGDTAEFAGAGWRVESSRRIAATSAEGRDIGLPAGSDLVVVTIDVAPETLDENDESPFCTVRLEEFVAGSVARSWSYAANEPISFTTTEGTEPYCSTELTEPYVLESIFVVSSDAGTDLAVALSVAEELPRYLSLRL